ncbi:hypothetical protein DL98DRAFT_525419 [Cadophora sp. DSE1049]|nr:hypothetical protein DL98DRAFT_525419 [Cadophora sp. DSE1049]
MDASMNGTMGLPLNSTIPMRKEHFHQELDAATATKVKIFAFTYVPLICLFGGFIGYLIRRKYKVSRRGYAPLLPQSESQSEPQSQPQPQSQYQSNGPFLPSSSGLSLYPDSTSQNQKDEGKDEESGGRTGGDGKADRGVISAVYQVNFIPEQTAAVLGQANSQILELQYLEDLEGPETNLIITSRLIK